MAFSTEICSAGIGGGLCAQATHGDRTARLNSAAAQFRGIDRPQFSEHQSISVTEGVSDVTATDPVT